MTEYSDQLALPVRGGWTGDPDIDARLKRNFRRIEDAWGEPHTVFGSRIISPLFFAQNETNFAFTAKSPGVAFAGEGTDVFVGVTVEIDRKQTAFVWGVAEFDNTDAGTDYNARFFLPVDVGGARSNGKYMQQFQLHGSPGHATISNVRRMNINVTAKTTVKFEWAWKQSDGSNQDITIYRQKMICALFDSPDVQSNGEISWTRSTVTKNAYRVAEGDDT